MNPYRVPLLALTITALSGCANLGVGADDSQCGRDLEAVQRAAAGARQELRQGVAPEQRQERLSRMVDAAEHARATCGYDAPVTPGTGRARQPKAG